MKDTVDKLNSFIVKIVLLLEEELDKIETTELEGALKIKGNLIDRLNKLVSLMVRLSKYSKDEIEPEESLSQSDYDIIEEYFQRYKLRQEKCQVSDGNLK